MFHLNRLQSDTRARLILRMNFLCFFITQNARFIIHEREKIYVAFDN